ncbi:MAG: nucleotidyltransferase family protein [Patescibacteria group bacterium]|mgnify:CR=1 FL=1
MPFSIKQVVLLSAGFGTRLKKVTQGKIPKAMAPLAGKPLLEHHLNQFSRFGVKEFFINLHHLPKAIRDYFGNGSKWGVKIHYFLEKNILGTAGGVKSFEGKLGESFFVIYGDIFSLVDYSKMAASFSKKPKGCIGMELVGETDHPEDSDLAETNKDLLFTKVYCKPHTSIPKRFKGMRGIYIFRKKILKFIPKNTYYEIDRNLLTEILAKGEKFYGYETHGEFLKDVGTLDRYRFVENYLKSLKQ